MRPIRGFALIELLIVLVIMVLLFLAAWRFEFSPGVNGGTPAPSAQQGIQGLNTAKQLQAQIDASSSEQQKQVDAAAK